MEIKLNTIIDAVTKAFPRVNLGGEKGDPKLAALDRGVLTVALLVAALDGSILPEEFAAFRTLAKKCRGGTAKNVHALVDEALPAVGRLMAMVQIGIYAEKELLAAFCDAATKALPRGFEDGSLADLRRAFVLWVTIGVADGKFSHIEKAAVAALEQHYAIARSKESQLQNPSASWTSRPQVLQLPQDCPRQNKVDPHLLEPDFLKKAEKIAHNLAIPENRAAAEAALDELIEKVKTVDDGGKAVVNSASGIAVNLAMMAMIGFMSAFSDKIV